MIHITVLAIGDFTVGKSGASSKVLKVPAEKSGTLWGLAEELKGENRSVDVQRAGDLGGNITAQPAEIIGIFVASTASAALLQEIVKDLYKSAKGWARAHFAKKKSRARPITFGVYSYDVVSGIGPDNELLFGFKIDSQGNVTLDYESEKLELEVRTDNSEDLADS